MRDASIPSFVVSDISVAVPENRSSPMPTVVPIRARSFATLVKFGVNCVGPVAPVAPRGPVAPLPEPAGPVAPVAPRNPQQTGFLFL
jgi:hypothetical protein